MNNFFNQWQWADTFFFTGMLLAVALLATCAGGLGSIVNWFERRFKKKVKIYCDGAGDCYCFVPEDGEPIIKQSMAEATHNMNEYSAVYAALDWVIVKNLPAVEIYTDSQLVVRQLNRVLYELGLPYKEPLYRRKDRKMQSLADKVRYLIKKSGIKVSFTWVRRSENLAGFVLEKLRKQKIEGGKPIW